MQKHLRDRPSACASSVSLASSSSEKSRVNCTHLISSSSLMLPSSQILQVRQPASAVRAINEGVDRLAGVGISRFYESREAHPGRFRSGSKGNANRTANRFGNRDTLGVGLPPERFVLLFVQPDVCSNHGSCPLDEDSSQAEGGWSESFLSRRLLQYSSHVALAVQYTKHLENLRVLPIIDANVLEVLHRPRTKTRYRALKGHPSPRVFPQTVESRTNSFPKSTRCFFRTSIDKIIAKLTENVVVRPGKNFYLHDSEWRPRCA